MKLSSSTISRLARYISAAISGVLAARAISAGSSGLFNSRSSQPLHLAVAGQLGHLAFDHLPFALVDVAVGLGRTDDGLEDRVAMHFGLGFRQAVDGLRLRCGAAPFCCCCQLL